MMSSHNEDTGRQEVRDELAGLHLQREVVDGGDVAVVPRQRLDRHAGHRRYSLTPSISRPSAACTSVTVANVSTSMTSPSTAMAPNCPSSFRSKMTTDITLVFGVKRMIEAESSRITRVMS